MNRHQISTEMQTAPKKHELTLELTSMCHISLTNYQKSQQSDIKMSYLQVKKEVTKDRSSSPIQWVFTRISPRISPVLCSPASRPKKRPFNTKPLGDKHCLQGIQSGPRPQMCLKIDGPKKYPANSFRNGFPFQQPLGREKNPNFETAPKILQIASKVAEKAPWSGKVEKQNKQ